MAEMYTPIQNESFLGNAKQHYVEKYRTLKKSSHAFRNVANIVEDKWDMGLAFYSGATINFFGALISMLGPHSELKANDRDYHQFPNRGSDRNARNFFAGASSLSYFVFHDIEVAAFFMGASLLTEYARGKVNNKANPIPAVSSVNSDSLDHRLE